MNILYVVDMLTILGGCELHMITLATEMAKTNKVYILTNHFNYDLGRMLTGIDVFVGFNKENYKKLENKNIDVIHSNPYTAVQVGDELSKRYNVDHVITIHGNNTSGLTQDIINNSKKIIYINETAKKACSNFKIDDKGIVVPNPIDTGKFKPKSVRLKKIRNLLVDEFKTIIILSRIDDGKEIPMFQLLRILPELVNRLGGLNVLFLGEGSKRIELMDAANKLNIPNLYIKFPGEVEDVSNYLNIADLVLACDRCAIEAVLCEKIVFYMGQSHWKQLIANENYYDLLFTDKGYTDYEDVDLTNHLTWMLTQAELVKQHTTQLSENIKASCDSKIVKEKIENIYKKK